MIAKDRIFKKGDVIVSGFGNIRILVGETGNGEAGDGAKGVFYDALTMYCESDSPTGTDMRYARHATAKEKNMFFDTLKANGLVYDAKKCTIKAGENYKGVESENVFARRNSNGPRPFKVLKKRIRPSVGQVRLMEEKIRLLDEVISTHVKQLTELKNHLNEVKGRNEKMYKDYCILQEANEKLKARNTTLEQSNKLIEAELILQKGVVKDMRADAAKLVQSNKECKDYIDYLLGRGLYARILNLK